MRLHLRRIPSRAGEGVRRSSRIFSGPSICVTAREGHGLKAKECHLAQKCYVERDGGLAHRRACQLVEQVEGKLAELVVDTRERGRLIDELWDKLRQHGYLAEDRHESSDSTDDELEEENGFNHS